MKLNMNSDCTIRVFTIRKSELTGFNVGTVSEQLSFPHVKETEAIRNLLPADVGQNQGRLRASPTHIKCPHSEPDRECNTVEQIDFGVPAPA